MLNLEVCDRMEYFAIFMYSFCNCLLDQIFIVNYLLCIRNSNAEVEDCAV